jgi:hypothetical protein
MFLPDPLIHSRKVKIVGFVVLNDGGMDAWLERRRQIEEHFQSDALVEAYLNGLIDWDGYEIGVDEYTYDY